eukprot:2464315-Pleurochrysis_carterae.AAC.1
MNSDARARMWRPGCVRVSFPTCQVQCASARLSVASTSRCRSRSRPCTLVCLTKQKTYQARDATEDMSKHETPEKTCQARDATEDMSKHETPQKT